MESLAKKEELPECPRKSANIFSYISFSWVLPILLKGRKKQLGMEDLYKPLGEHKADLLGNKLEKAWQEECKKKKAKNQAPSLLSAGLSVFGWNIMLLGFLLFFMEMCLKVTQPIFLGKIIQYYANPEKSNISEAYLYSGAIILSSALNVMFTHPYMLSNLHCGMKLRVSACSMIYRKSLRLSKKAIIDTTSGQIVNLLSNDVGRLDLAVMFVHYLWVGPVETIVVTYFMYQEIGISAIFGTLFLLAFIPFQFYLGKKTSQLRLKTALRTDERVRLMNEIIQGIQVIKMYAWEKPFAKMVSLTRKKEIKVIRYVSWIRGILLSFIIFTTRVSVFISLVAYALLGNIVTAQQAFVIVAYYNILRQTMTVFFPQSIGMFAETLVSVKRLEKYMLYDELEKDALINQKTSKKHESYSNDKAKEAKNGNVVKVEETVINNEKTKTTPIPITSIKIDPKLRESAGILMENVTARWNPDSTDNTLSNVNLHVQPTTICALIGKVGSGKSSIIQAILGELPIESGSIKVNGVISYAAQEPWLFSGSIRQNILFGQPMDKSRYKKVLSTCSLTRDIELWADGDKTVVGERGTSLSGGQKARINLARAVYREAGIYLLDDPLSAVDSHVGRHLYENCIKDFLKDKIVVLVTHQLQYLPTADQILLMDSGHVIGVGTFDSLKDSGLDFAKLLPAEEDAPEEESDLKRTGSKNSNFKRHNSVSSVGSKDDDKADNAAEPMEEKRAEGNIGLFLYKAYFKAAGGYCIVIFVFVFFLLSQLTASAGDYFLTYWVNKEAERAEAQNATASTSTPETSSDDDSIWGRAVNFMEGLQYDKNWDIYFFTILTVLTVVTTLTRSIMFFNIAMKASKKLHDAMFTGVTRATMYFFGTNPSGRILNRFSKDMGQIDEILPSIMIDVIQIFLSLFGIVVVLSIVNPYNLIPTAVLGILFYFMRKFYLMSSRNIKRMEATTRSPIYSHLAASLNGLSTIRAFNAEEILTREFDNHQDLHSSAFYLFIATSRAFGFWLDFCCVIYIAIVVMTFFLGENTGGNVGLAITQALGMTGMVQWGMRQSAELENSMTCVERIVEYDSVDPEPALESAPDKKPPKEWPENGAIKFDKLSLCYSPDPDADKVLKEMEFEVLPQEKIGIVGRTGAGKSSIINALFRLSYNEGSITIDTRNTSEIGLHELRSKISIIPQEPVLFSGSMRYNLDPFDEYADEKLWSALEEVKLKEVVSELPAGLNTKISEGGSNFSVGQRQLVCLARAILRENKILVMDEATANVDPQTDALIQMTIRDKFSECTVLTIAHRLNTVMDSDRILVVDAGKCVEFASPHELLKKTAESKIFYNMVKETGKSTFESLKKIAEENYLKRKME
ncbi:unnamed protein product [Diamesa tonsa]